MYAAFPGVADRLSGPEFSALGTVRGFCFTPLTEVFSVLRSQFIAPELTSFLALEMWTGGSFFRCSHTFSAVSSRSSPLPLTPHHADSTLFLRLTVSTFQDFCWISKITPPHPTFPPLRAPQGPGAPNFLTLKSHLSYPLFLSPQMPILTVSERS